MKGKHKIEVRSKRIVFTIELERNITILRGDSATGKTTLIKMLSDYETYGRKSGVTVVCDKTCRVLAGVYWETQLNTIRDSIVFVDEGSTFVSSLDFARAFKRTDNYYVLVTRENLSTLPYSVNAILELKKTTSKFKCTYNKAYPIYDSLSARNVNLENIEKLLSLEDPDNSIEIVVHVNMLKEGWDVNNLYTIIPLRASASETLTEQTIGRGLRLPYGQRTGVPEVDRLSIVSHDKYQKIIDLANDPNSLVRKVYYIDEAAPQTEEPRETVEMPSSYDETTSDDSFMEQLAMTFMQSAGQTTAPEEAPAQEQALEVAKFVAHFTAQSVMELNKQVKTYDAAKDEDAKKFVQQTVVNKTLQQFSSLQLNKEDIASVVAKAIETCVQVLTDKVIPVPQAVVQPFMSIKQGYYPFKLDTRNMTWHPGDDTLLGTELKEDGDTFEVNTHFHAQDVVDTPENEIVRHLIVYDDIDYQSTADLLYGLVEDAKEHFLTYLTEEETEKVMRDRQKSIAEMIYQQMREHFYREETKFKASEMRPFSRIEPSFGGKFKSDEIYDLRANIPASEVKGKIFKGFKKACHTLYKFDSNTERIFAMVLENDAEVLKWMRPSPKQFNIYYGPVDIAVMSLTSLLRQKMKSLW